MTFDTTLTDLALEKKRLSVEQLKLQLQQEEARLGELLDTTPNTPIVEETTPMTYDYVDVEVPVEEDPITELKVVSELVSQCVNENARKKQSQEAYAKKYNGLVRRYEKAEKRQETPNISL